MDESVQRKVKELEEKQTEAELLTALAIEFPDLKIINDRWGRQRYSSASVNARATDVDLHHNCGCCSDSPLEARPYIQTMGVQVFTDPDRHWVADKYDGLYEIPAPDWEKRMREREISDTAIEKVRVHLAATTPPEYEYDDDNDDDDNDHDHDSEI